MNKELAFIFDTETTGLVEPQVVESALLEVTFEGGKLVSGALLSGLWRPSKPIELGALATHHILDEELENAPPFSEFALPENTQYLIGHNIDFDWNVIGKPNVKRICTQALARAALPDLDSHKQSALIYHFFRSDAREMLRNAHSAGDDVINCLELLKALLPFFPPVESFEELWHVSERARVPKRMYVGKHKGELIAGLPHAYKMWMLRQPDYDPYVLQAVKESL